MTGRPPGSMRSARMAFGDLARLRISALREVWRWKLRMGPALQPGPAWLGMCGAIAGLFVGGVILFALPPLSDSTVLKLRTLAAPRTGLVILLAVLLSEVFVPRLQPLWRLVLPALGIAWMALNLFFFWRTAHNGGGLLGGIIPWSDAADYYAGAVELANGGLIAQFNMRRPMNVVLLSLRLRLADGSLMGALAIGAGAAALALLVAAREIGRSVGMAAAVAFFMVLALYIVPLVPTTLSETHGLILGALAFACLWRAAISRSLATYGFGAFVLVVANATRAGPILIIPAVILWAALVLEPEKRWSWRAVGIGALACAAGLAVPLTLNRLLGDGSGAFQANFAVVLYGIAVGGKDWSQAYIDHPELLGTGVVIEAKASLIIYRLAFEAILADPRPFLTYYFTQLGNAGNFLWWLIPNYTLRVMTVVGGLWCLVTLRRRLSLLLVLALIGTLVSAPFLIRDGGYRVFVVAMPFLAGMCAYGIAAIARTGIALVRPMAAGEPAQPSPGPVGDRLAVACALVVLAATVSPFIGRGPQLDPPTADAGRCGGDAYAVHFEEGRWGTSLRVGREKTHWSQPAVRWDDFNSDPEFKGLHELRPLFGAARPPFDLALVVHKRRNRSEFGYAFAMSALPLPTDGPVLLCGKLAPHELTHWVGPFLLVDRIEPLTPDRRR
jgi:hypothetical protein